MWMNVNFPFIPKNLTISTQNRHFSCKKFKLHEKSALYTCFFFFWGGSDRLSVDINLKLILSMTYILRQYQELWLPRLTAVRELFAFCFESVNCWIPSNLPYGIRIGYECLYIHYHYVSRLTCISKRRITK